MSSSLRRDALFALTLLLAPSFLTVHAQEDKAPFGREVELGLRFRGALISSRSELTTGREVETGRKVFRQLLDTSFVQDGDAFPYQLTVLSSDEINASSFAGGQIFAEGGIARLLSRSPGLWAAVLSHEIAHTLLHHHYRAYLRQEAIGEQIALYRQRQAAGDASAAWALLALRLGGGLVDLKLSRDEEHEADRLGLLMMAEAGYHPDFAIAGFRRIAEKTGDLSKLRAFFTTHPRWETREQRQLKAYGEAAAIFERHWPNPAKSPGGQPPVIATILGVAAEKIPRNREALIRGTLDVRNAQNRTIYVVVRFFHRGRPVPVSSDAPESYNVGGNGLETGFRANLLSGNETTGIALTVPTAVIGIRERHLKARLSVLDGEGNILDSTKEFSVSFPD